MYTNVNTHEIFDNMPFDEWIELPKFSKELFHSFFMILDEPGLREGIDIYFNIEMTKFKKVRHGYF